MFYLCSSLEHFSGDLSNLKTGWRMFGGGSVSCNLSLESVENIANSIQDIRSMSRTDSDDWYYYYYMGSSCVKGLIDDSLRGVISIYTNLSSIYHKIKKKYYICILYDMLWLWQRVRWGLNYPESWSRRCRLLASK